VFGKPTRASREWEIQYYTTVNILFVNPILRNDSSSNYLPVGTASVMTCVSSKGFFFDLLDGGAKISKIIDIRKIEKLFDRSVLPNHYRKI
jgi:hypothetical protein